MLSDTQQAAFMQQLSEVSEGVISADTTVEELCVFLVNLFISGDPSIIDREEEVDETLDFLEEVGQIDSATHANIESCLTSIHI